MLECVMNVSEGKSDDVIDALRDAAGDALLDLHTDSDHHRSVLTLAGWDVEDAVRCVTRRAVELMDLTGHEGVHPRMGVVDVVPFVPLFAATIADAVAARHRFACWAAERLGLPCFFYGPERTLPDVRRGAFRDLPPDVGPAAPHPTAGAVAVGARPALVAYNVWLADPDLALATRVASEIRVPGVVRTLALRCSERVQVSMNLVDPRRFGPADAFDAVASRAGVAGAELVGLVPAAVLDAIDPARWAELDLSASRTIEARLQEAGLDGGRFGAAPLR